MSGVTLCTPFVLSPFFDGLGAIIVVPVAKGGICDARVVTVFIYAVHSPCAIVSPSEYGTCIGIGGIGC